MLKNKWRYRGLLISVFFALFLAVITAGIVVVQLGKSGEELPSFGASDSTAKWQRSDDPETHISFLYPPNFGVKRDRYVLVDGTEATYVILTEAKSGLEAGFGIVRYPDLPAVGDKVTGLVNCPFKSSHHCWVVASSADDTERLPSQVKFIMQVPEGVYGVSWGQEGDFDITRGLGPQILSTLTFGAQ